MGRRTPGTQTHTRHRPSTQRAPQTHTRNGLAHAEHPKYTLGTPNTQWVSQTHTGHPKHTLGTPVTHLASSGAHQTPQTHTGHCPSTQRLPQHAPRPNAHQASSWDASGTPAHTGPPARPHAGPAGPTGSSRHSPAPRVNGPDPALSSPLCRWHQRPLPSPGRGWQPHRSGCSPQPWGSSGELWELGAPGRARGARDAITPCCGACFGDGCPTSAPSLSHVSLVPCTGGAWVATHGGHSPPTAIEASTRSLQGGVTAPARASSRGEGR